MPSADIASRLPGLGPIVRERDALRAERDALREERDALRAEAARLREVAGELLVPAGHFYSPFPSLTFVREQAARLFGPPPRTLPGIDLREEAQLALLDALQPFYDTLHFPRERTPGHRYWYANPAYSFSDAIFLHCLLRHLRPRRVLEVGSGHSSCATLDTVERDLGGAVACTFVEPYPALLRSLLAPGDEARIRILERPVQEVGLEPFLALEANDALFIDSTHVSKIGSDVNFLLFEVLPRLAPGVHVHVHDIHYPFEYPRPWIEEGRAWTEAYLLRAFLAFNGAFEIVLCNTFLERFHEARFRARMPLCLENPGGSLWLRRAR